MRLVLPALLLLAASGCATDPLVERTHPEASAFHEVSVSTLYGAVVGHYNVTANIAEIIACPPDVPNVDCVPGAILLVDHLYPDPPQIRVTLYPTESGSSARARAT